uniref:NADH dehydrogenase subunit 4L n=1 Tax=Megalophaedusa pilsbryana TaxID=1885874 RepID=A0A224AAN7_9EUPU|nr:NADH dehydrogenase subunit 4L [Megalophaedusa pilsbryana]
MILLMFLSLLVMFINLIFFSIRYKYLSALLVLEVLILTALIFLLSAFNSAQSSLYTVTILLTLGVCEASLGLGLLVSFIKLNSSDKISPNVFS